MIGKMRDRVLLQIPNGSPDEIKGRDRSFRNVAEIWAEVSELSDNRLVLNSASLGGATHEMTIRYRSDVKIGWRAAILEEDDQGDQIPVRHEIVGLSRPDRMKNYLILKTRYDDYS